MQRYKIVFCGGMGSGKSQAISSLSEIPVFATEALNTDEEAHSKLHTTVGIDYGEITIDDTLKIGLYGTPGQNRFQFMWPTIAQGALGIVILIDHSAANPLADLDIYLESFVGKSDRIIVIGVTHVDVSSNHSFDIYRRWLIDHKKRYPIFSVDARQKDDVLLLVETIIASLEVQVEA
ncbi:GTP-binding protein [Aquirhabdus sp.]|uniref:GTP-binding protein n=1 Tax=Aquirhabdus sp. TaxID=2824160 RepID=UPI00396CD1DE